MLSLSSFSRSIFSSGPLRPASSLNVSLNSNPLTIFTRNRSQLAPRQVKYIKRHKGVIPIPTGGSIKGTTLAFGEWGIRIKGNGVRFSAKQLTTAEDVIKRKLKVLKGSKVWLRVFPDIPVCIKGNETRMGKGKGTFEFWAARIPTGRVIFEIGGVPIREELARDILRQAAAKLPTKMEFISRTTPPRLGNLVLHPPKLVKPDSTDVSLGAMETSSSTAQPTVTA
ncbi:39S ribosomal protein L16, mitochondrial [Stygiomarasmius scandens]|uniref:39S ribosomal protein L16, mitochondrial n=1 Tax=Marasmiellus scandens TaxID=2682957 RepID=A0ABR1JWT9_9AGAR